MSAICSILVLCSKTATANSIAFPLQRSSMEVAIALTREEALEKLKKQFFDMVIVESKLSDQPGLAFLAEVRRLFPLAMRVLFETEPVNIDFHILVNEAAPCAIFQGTVDPDRIWRLLALEGPVMHSSIPTSSGQSLNAEQLRARNNQLLHDNQLLAREVKRLRQLQIQHIQQAAGNRMPADGWSDEAGVRLSDGDREKSIEQICAVMDRLLVDQEVVLPVLPAVGLKVQKLLANDDCSFEEIASMVGLEQGMSARILQVANSPIYAGLERIRNLHQAVTRLGLRETRNLLLAVIAENLFKTKHQGLVNLMARLWMHSLCCAYSNEEIALSLQIPESDDYFMLGLLHDVGKLLVIHLGSQALQKDLITPAEFREEAVLEVMARRHNSLGAMLMDQWQYSGIFKEIALRHDDPLQAVNALSEPMIVTHFSNMLTRKLGYSLVPNAVDLPNDWHMASALNINEGMLLRLENTLQDRISKIKQTYFGGKQ